MGTRVSSPIVPEGVLEVVNGSLGEVGGAVREAPDEREDRVRGVGVTAGVLVF